MDKEQRDDSDIGKSKTSADIIDITEIIDQVTNSLRFQSDFDNSHHSFGKTATHIKSLPLGNRFILMRDTICFKSLMMLYSIVDLYHGVTSVVFDKSFTIKTPYITIKDHELVFASVTMVIIKIPDNQFIHELIPFKQLFPNCKTLVLDIDFEHINKHVIGTHDAYRMVRSKSGGHIHNQMNNSETDTFEYIKHVTAERLVLVGDMNKWSEKSKLLQAIAKVLAECPNITSLVLYHAAVNIYKLPHDHSSSCMSMYWENVVFANPLTLYLYRVKLRVLSDNIGIKSIELLHNGSYGYINRKLDSSNPNWLNLD